MAASSKKSGLSANRYFLSKNVIVLRDLVNEVSVNHQTSINNIKIVYMNAIDEKRSTCLEGSLFL